MSFFLVTIIVATLFIFIQHISCVDIQCTQPGIGCNDEFNTTIQCPVNDECRINCTLEKSCYHLRINGRSATEVIINCGNDNSCSQIYLICPPNSSRCIINNANNENINNITIISSFGIDILRINYSFTSETENNETYIGDMWCSEEDEENEKQDGKCKVIVSNNNNNNSNDCINGCCSNPDPVCNDFDPYWYTKFRNWYLEAAPYSYLAVIAIVIFCCCFCFATCCCAACCCREDEKNKKKRKKVKKHKHNKHKHNKHKSKDKKKKRKNNKHNEYPGNNNNNNNTNNDGFNLLINGESLHSSSLKSSGNNIDVNVEIVPITPPPLRLRGFAAINNECDNNDISSCNIIDRLLKLMASYENWNELPDAEIKWNAITQIFDSQNCNYDLIQLIDDYNHYLSHHDNTENIMFIYNLLSNHQCNKDHINDDIGNGRIHLMNNDKLQVTIQDIFRIEIIDKMHIYFMHTHHEQVEVDDDMKEPQQQQQQQQHDFAAIDSDTNDNYPHTLTSAYDYIDSMQNTKSVYSQYQYQQKSPKYNNNNNNNNTNHNVDDGEDDDDDDDGIPLQISRQSTLCDKKKQILAKLHCRKSSKYINKYVTEVTAGQESQYKINYDTKETQTQTTTLRQTESIDMVRKTVTIDSMLSIDEGFDDSEDGESMNIEQEEQELALYCFGRRWYYWTKYKQQDHKDYINAKYKDLKEELLHNSQYNISERFDWDTTYLKAQSYKQCARAKSLFANGILVYKYYGKSDKEESIPIHTEHIAALLFYCNYDELQAKFSESFRILDKEQDWNNAKLRNEEFAHWSRLLRESVELYGLKFRNYPNIMLYHGINCELMFESVVCQFCAPTSMTTSMGVAESFSDGFGLILEVKLYDLDVAFFDCSWISNYPTENEKLLMGGGEGQSVLLNSIILSRLGHNYGFYIQSVGIIQNMFDGRRNPHSIDDSEGVRKLNKKTIIAVRKLIQSIDDSESDGNDGNDIPYYVQQLFSRFCNNWTKPVIIDIHKFNKKTEYGHFKDLIVNHEDEWIQIDKICKMFKNTKCIKIINGFNLTEKTLNKLYDVFNNNDDKENIFSNLNQIEFQDINEINYNIEENTEEFERINWNLGDNDDGNTILLIRSSSVEIVNNGNVSTPI